MKKFTVLSIFVIMSLFLHARWGKSNFWNEIKTSYKVSLCESDAPALSNADASKLISILAKYDWEENTGSDEPTLEMRQGGWGRYHYYIRSYSIYIDHPLKKKMKLRFDGHGIAKDEYLIERKDGKPYGLLRLKGEYDHSNLSSEDIAAIKQLFFDNVEDFRNIETIVGESVEVINNYSFADLFNIKLPIKKLDENISTQLIDLYNTAWNNLADSFEGGTPLPTIYLNVNPITFKYGNNYYQYSPNNFEFSPKNKVKLDTLVARAMKEHDGEKFEENEYRKGEKIRYQYKDGLLHGKVELYNTDGKKTHTLIYEKGLPIGYVKYYSNERKRVEVHLQFAKRFVKWVEYDPKGQVEDSGENSCRISFHAFSDHPEMFYKPISN